MPAAASEAVLLLIGKHDTKTDIDAASRMFQCLEQKPRSKAATVCFATLRVPANMEAKKAIKQELAPVGDHWRLTIVAHGEESGTRAAGLTGAQLALEISLLTKLMGVQPMSVELVVCFAALKHDETGLAGSFCSFMKTYGCEVDVTAYGHRVSVDLQGGLFNPTGMTMLDTNPRPIERWEFDHDDDGHFRAMQIVD
jgi:Peptidase C80 family